MLTGEEYGITFVIFNRLADSKLASFGASRSWRFARTAQFWIFSPRTRRNSLSLLFCNQCQPCNYGMRSNPEIVVSDQLAFCVMKRRSK
jgi:hypothetical protein